MKRLMSITITLLFVFALVFSLQVAETQAQSHMGDDDHMADSPWDDEHMTDSPWDDDDHMTEPPWDDDHMNDFPWDADDHMDGFPWDDDYMNDSPQYNNMPASMYWMYLWMLYMWLFMGPGF